MNNFSNKLTEEFLRRECKYKSNKLIAIENNCSISTVRKYLKKYNLLCFNPTNKGKILKNRLFERDRGRFIENRDNPERLMRRRYHNVMEKHIGRKVDTSHEVVHHLNRDSKDDRLENLVLMEKTEHDRLHLILRNKSLQSCDLDTALKLLFKNDFSDEMKRYAELTRIIPKCKK